LWSSSGGPESRMNRLRAVSRCPVPCQQCHYAPQEMDAYRHKFTGLGSRQVSMSSSCYWSRRISNASSPTQAASPPPLSRRAFMPQPVVRAHPVRRSRDFRIMQRFGDHNGEECELGGRTDGPNDRNRRTDFEQSGAPPLSGASSAVPSASAGYAAQPALSIARNGEVSRAASYPCR
jgi:hypothetical protein